MERLWLVDMAYDEGRCAILIAILFGAFWTQFGGTRNSCVFLQVSRLHSGTEWWDQGKLILLAVQNRFLTASVDTIYVLHLRCTWHTWYTAAVPDIGYMKLEVLWNEGFFDLSILDQSWSCVRMCLVRILQHVLSGWFILRWCRWY